MITNVRGHFDDYDVEMTSSADDFSDASVIFRARVASINTGIEARDNHLRSDDFFNAELYPEIVFRSTAMRHEQDSHYVLEGDLTIRDVTRHIELKAEFGGMATDPYGNVKAGFELEGNIHRKEFHLLWDMLTETGGMVVSDEVRLFVSVQMIKPVNETVAA